MMPCRLLVLCCAGLFGCQTRSDTPADHGPGAELSITADRGPADRSVASDRSSFDGGVCDLGLPRWTGPEYQEQDDALLEFEGESEAIEVKSARLYRGVGEGRSSIFELDGFYLRRAAEVICLRDTESLEYNNSHHNWRDQAVATEGDRRYLLDLTFDLDTGEWIYKVSSLQGAQNRWGPIDLKLVAGPNY